jgi:predicted RecA/RadA family phage recombinase
MAAGKFHSEGDVIDYTPGSAVTAGTCVLFGALIGFPERDIAASAKGSLRIRGVVEHDKADSQAWTAGAKLYWDDSAKNFTTTSSGNTLCATAYEAVASTAGLTRGKVILNTVN